MLIKYQKSEAIRTNIACKGAKTLSNYQNHSSNQIKSITYHFIITKTLNNT